MNTLLKLWKLVEKRNTNLEYGVLQIIQIIVKNIESSGLFSRIINCIEFLNILNSSSYFLSN